MLLITALILLLTLAAALPVDSKNQDLDTVGKVTGQSLLCSNSFGGKNYLQGTKGLPGSDVMVTQTFLNDTACEFNGTGPWERYFSTQGCVPEKLELFFKTPIQEEYFYKEWTCLYETTNNITISRNVSVADYKITGLTLPLKPPKLSIVTKENGYNIITLGCGVEGPVLKSAVPGPLREVIFANSKMVYKGDLYGRESLTDVSFCDTPGPLPLNKITPYSICYGTPGPQAIISLPFSVMDTADDWSCAIFEKSSQAVRLGAQHAPTTKPAWCAELEDTEPTYMSHTDRILYVKCTSPPPPCVSPTDERPTLMVNGIDIEETESAFDIVDMVDRSAVFSCRVGPRIVNKTLSIKEIVNDYFIRCNYYSDCFYTDNATNIRCQVLFPERCQAPTVVFVNSDNTLIDSEVYIGTEEFFQEADSVYVIIPVPENFDVTTQNTLVVRMLITSHVMGPVTSHVLEPKNANLTLCRNFDSTDIIADSYTNLNGDTMIVCNDPVLDVSTCRVPKNEMGRAVYSLSWAAVSESDSERVWHEIDSLEKVEIADNQPVWSLRLKKLFIFYGQNFFKLMGYKLTLDEFMQWKQNNKTLIFRCTKLLDQHNRVGYGYIRLDTTVLTYKDILKEGLVSTINFSNLMDFGGEAIYPKEAEMTAPHPTEYTALLYTIIGVAVFLVGLSGALILIMVLKRKPEANDPKFRYI